MTENKGSGHRQDHFIPPALQEREARAVLGRALYEAFWKRNGGGEPAWCDQASAIRNMWDAIADDAAQALADAALISAAPDMAEALEDASRQLAVLRLALKVCMVVMGDDAEASPMLSESAEIIERSEAALQKARGGES